MTTLHIQLLGSFQVIVENEPAVGFDSDKVRALLAYLAVEQARPLRRELLAGLLWPNKPKTRALASLRHALSNLRGVINDKAGHYLSITRQAIQFNAASDAFVDAVQFEKQLAAEEPSLAQMEAAVSLVNGRFLTDFSLADNLAFEEWTLLKREQYQRQAIATLNYLTCHYESHFRYDTALDFAWQQVTLEPWHESGQRQLIRLLDKTGQHARALAHFEQFQADIRAELAVKPENVTLQLVEQIRATTTDRSRQKQPSFLSLPPTTPAAPFVARTKELAQLNQHWETAVSGQGHTVFITGEAGSGKTCLLRAFAQQVQLQQPETIPLWGSCQAHSGRGSPYLPFCTALSLLAGQIEPHWQNGSLNKQQATRLWMLRQRTVLEMLQHGPDLVGSLVSRALFTADQLTELTAVSHQPSQTILLAQVAAVLQKTAQHGPILLLLDDLQWATSSTLDMLTYLGQQLAGYPILIAAAYRPEEVVQSINDERHPLLRLAHELALDFGDINIDLDQASGRPFVDALLDSEPNRLDSNFRQMLYRQTKGHALFTVELLASLKLAGVLWQDEAGYWQTGSGMTWQNLPARVEASIAERIARLPKHLQVLLTAASVQGDSFLAEVVAQVNKTATPEVIQKLSGELTQTHRLVIALGRQQAASAQVSHYQFRHSLFQKYLYGRLDAVQCSHLHEATALALEKIIGKAAETNAAATLAWHFERANYLDKAIHYHREAGEYALRLAASAEALHHFQQAEQLWQQLPASQQHPNDEINLLLKIGSVLIATKGYGAPDVKMVYGRVRDLCIQTEVKPELVTALFWLTSYYAVSGQLNKAVDVSNQMLTVAEKIEEGDLPKLMAWLLAGLPRFFRGEIEEALTYFEKVIALYDPQKHQALAHAVGQDVGIAGVMWSGHALFHLGYLDQAQSRFQTALEMAAQSNHHFTQVFTKILAGSSPFGYVFGDYEAAVAYGRSALTLAQKSGYTVLAQMSSFFLGQSQVAQTQQEPDRNQEQAEGLARMEQGVQFESDSGHILGITSHWTSLAQAYLQAGEIQKAAQAMVAAEGVMQDSGERYFVAELYRVKGELLLVQAEDSVGAEAHFQQAISTAQQQKAKWFELRAAISLFCLWQQQGKIREAHLLLKNVYDWFAEGFTMPDLSSARTLLTK